MKFKIILASNSPRRRELLKMIVPEFELADPVEVDESYQPLTPAEDIPVAIARNKSKAYRHLEAEDTLILTSDTVVVAGGKVLGKPHDHDEAVAMLRRLSGHWHKVITGVALRSAHYVATASVTTKVHFRRLTDKEIDFYVDTYKPYDKAGAYGIQEWIGCVAIDRIDGDYYNVMGLPLHKVYEMLYDFGAIRT